MIYSKNFSQMLQDTIQDLHVVCYYYIFSSIVIIQCLNFVLKIFLISVILEILSQKNCEKCDYMVTSSDMCQPIFKYWNL